MQLRRIQWWHLLAQLLRVTRAHLHLSSPLPLEGTPNSTSLSLSLSLLSSSAAVSPIVSPIDSFSSSGVSCSTPVYNPLVRAGLIPAELADILSTPPATKKPTKWITGARELTADENYVWLRGEEEKAAEEKERKSEERRRKKEKERQWKLQSTIDRASRKRPKNSSAHCQLSLGEGEPQAEVQEGEPQAEIQEGEPQAEIQEGEPQADIQEGEPQAQVQEGEPQADIQEGEPQARVQEGEPQAEIQEGEPPSSGTGGGTPSCVGWR